MSRRGTMLPKPNYDVGERPWCFHGEMLYEAKILEIQQDTMTDPPRYLVHYKGWKATWDDLVGEDRLRKANDENRELAMQLNRQVKDAQKVTKPDKHKKKGLASDFGSARGSEERSGTGQATGRGQKRGRNMEIEEVGNFSLPDAKKLRPSPIVTDAAPDRPRRKKRTIKPKLRTQASNTSHLPPSIYTYIDTGLYSPTESLAPYLDSDWTNVKSKDDIPDIRSHAKVPAASDAKQRKKRPAPLDFDAEEGPLNESVVQFEKRRKRFDEKLQKRIQAWEAQIQGDVQEHSDFPHPVDRQKYPVDENDRQLPYQAPINAAGRPPSLRTRIPTAKARALASNKKSKKSKK
ncbi:MAG: hypothetical protein Q9174_005348, partial [Haloplaca sp. 1 TL-2023]